MCAYTNINVWDSKIYISDIDDSYIPHIGNIEITQEHRTKCAYCNRIFSSRNKLFIHLGFNNVDIRHNIEKVQHNDKFKKIVKWTWIKTGGGGKWKKNILYYSSRSYGIAKKKRKDITDMFKSIKLTDNMDI